MAKKGKKVVDEQARPAMTGNALINRLVASMSREDILRSIDPEISSHPVARNLREELKTKAQADVSSMLGLSINEFDEVVGRAKKSYASSIKKRGSSRKEASRAAVSSLADGLKLSDVSDIGDPAKFGITLVGEVCTIERQVRQGDIGGVEYDQDILVVSIRDAANFTKTIRSWEWIVN